MKKILFGLFLISLITRLFFLFNGHAGITHDEADFYYNGYLVSKTGSDLYGNKLFFTSGVISATPNIPIYLSSLFWHLTDKTSVLMGRLPFSLLNSLTPVVLMWILFELSGNLPFSLIVFCIINFSPWFLNISSTVGYDSPLSLLFALCSFLSLLKIKNKQAKIFLFIFFNFLAFNSYMGYRIISLFSMLIQLIAVDWKQNSLLHLDKKTIKKYLIFLALSLSLFIIFLIPTFLFPNSSILKTRSLNENVFTNKNPMGDILWYGNETTSSPIIGRIFANKIFTPFALLLKSWINTFNLPIFFVGEPHPIYGLRILGLFFMTDIFLFLLGLVSFRETFPRKLYPMVAIFIFGGLPFAISASGFTVALRGLMLIIPYSLVIATGYYYLHLKHKKIFHIVVLVFIVNIVSVLLLYSYRIKVMSSESFHLTDKMMIEDIIKSRKVIHIFPTEFKQFVMLYSFYSSDDPNWVKPQLSNNNLEVFENKEKRVYIYKSCKDFDKLKKGSYVLVSSTFCNRKGSNYLKFYEAKDRSKQILYSFIQK